MAALSEPLGLSRNLPSEPKAGILLVDDNPANLLSLRAILEELGQNLVDARSSEEALQRVQSDEFAVILLDVLMPGVSGFETAKLIRDHDRSRHTPIIFLTASDIDRPQLEQGYALGAVDLLVKPLLPVVLRAKVRGFIELFEETQRARREAAQLRLLVHATTDYAIFMLDPNGHVLTWNSGAERLKGYKADEIIGQHFSRFYPQEAIDRGWPAHELRVAQAEGRFEDEGWRVRKDGSRFWANVVITALHDEAGNFLGFSKITRDLTERKRSEENAHRLVEEAAARRAAEENARLIQEQRERLRVTLASIGDAVISTDAQGCITFLNPVAENLVGWKTEEAAGRNLSDVFRIVNGETRQPVENPAIRALRDGRIVGLANHTVLISKEGMERPIDDSAAPIRDADGIVVGSVLVFRDISERKRAEEALREAERRWRSLAEALPNLVWTDLPDGQCDYLSSQWGTYTGIPENELLGLRWLETVIHPDDRRRTLACWQAACADLADYDLEYRIRRHDGQYRWFKTRGVPIRDESGRIIYWFGTCTDIEDYKRAEEALREADRRKDEFLATLAHELRNPLAPIRNALQILRMPRVDAETVERSRDMMERQVHHLVRLVDDLLDMSRVMRGKIELRRERVELATVVARAVETAQPLVDAQGHQLSVRLPSESLPIDADPVRLGQVVGNLLTNAAKYTEPHGHIGLTAEREGDVAVLRVRDNGIGIAPDMLPHIFELFVQVDHAATRSQGGLGIGLTLVKNLVEMHNGTVEARSEGLGRGSEFVVRLPISAQALDQEEGRETGRQAPEPPYASGQRLLVVDDNQDAANSLAMLLRLQGHEVRVAYSGVAALEMTKAYSPDVVFLDIGMPGMDGYEVARRLRQQPGLEKVVLAALTGWGQQEDRRRSAEAGFDHHLVKPPEPKALESLLADLK